MKARFRLSDVDRQRLGGGEWLELNFDAVQQLGVNVLSEFEERSGICVSELGAELQSAAQTQRLPLRFIKALVWLARRVSGHDDDYAVFDFSPLAMEFNTVEDEQRPKNRAERRAAVKGSRRSSTNTNV